MTTCRAKPSRKALLALARNIRAAFDEIYQNNRELNIFKGSIVELPGLRPTGFFEVDELRANAFDWNGPNGRNKFAHLRLNAKPIFRGGRRGRVQEIDDIFNIRILSKREWAQKKVLHPIPSGRE